MPFAILLIGALLIIVAFNNSYPALVSELETDVPGYFKWAAAIAAILALGYVPGLRTPSRWLLGLVLVVIVITNYQQILAGFSSFASNPATGSASGAQGAANPSASYVATYAPAAASTATTGTTVAAGAQSGTQVLTAAQALAANPLNPAAYTQLAQGFGGIA